MRRLLGATMAGVVLGISVPAHGGIFSGIVERAVEQQISKHFSQPTAPSVSLPPAGSFASCGQLFPKGVALDAAKVERQWGATALCSNHFAVIHSRLSKTPLIVVERLSRVQMAQAQDEARTDEFYPDPRLPASARAELEDYRGSGLDRGHLAPAGNQPNPESMAQSFALSNMVPQDPTNNRKAWAKIESDVRKFARRAQGDVYVFSGPLFRGEQRTIGRNRVWVPSHLFKLVYDEASGRSWAYIIENTASARADTPIGYTAFVETTGWHVLESLHGPK